MAAWITYVVAVLIVLLAGSNVVPWYIVVRQAHGRSRTFLQHLRALHQSPPAHPDQGARNWLLNHQARMQEDAELVGKGILIATTPAAVGGQTRTVQVFEEMFNESAELFYGLSDQVVHDRLQATIGALVAARQIAKHNLFNPWAWLRLSFERVVAFPSYALRVAGFHGPRAESGGRIAGLVLNLIITVATIAGLLITGGWWTPNHR